MLRSFRRPLQLVARHRIAVGLGVLMVAGFSLIKIAMAGVIGRTIDGLRADADDAAQLLFANVLVLIGLIVGEAICRYFGRKWIIDASRNVEARLKSELMHHLSRLPVNWYDRAQTGDVLSRLTQDVELLRFLIGPTILYGSQILFTLPVGIYVMAQLSSSVTLAVLGAFGVLLVALLIFMPRLQIHSQRVQEDIAEISQHAQESFAGIRVLFHFAKTHVFAQRLDRLNGKYVDDNMAMTRFRAGVHLIIHFTTDLVMLAVLLFGLIEVIDGRMTEGGLVEFITIMGFLVWPLIAAGWILGVVHRARAAADRIDELFAASPEQSPGTLVPVDTCIEVQDLTFTYPGETKPALAGISFELAAGQKLGLVGAVGSGKSTLLHLLLRLYDPPAGTIFVGGQDVLEIDLVELRRRFAIAPQEPFLFSDTLADNVRFGRAGTVADTDVDAAVHAAALEPDLDALPDGLATIVGERGVTLSGGQKQRVSLARALLAKRPAVILDDTLSAVDHATEAKIVASLTATASRSTVLVASHRLSAVAGADLILVLESGEVVERGRHSELLQRGGRYATAWRTQREAQALGGDLDAPKGGHS